MKAFCCRVVSLSADAEKEGVGAEAGTAFSEVSARTVSCEDWLESAAAGARTDRIGGVGESYACNARKNPPTVRTVSITPSPSGLQFQSVKKAKVSINALWLRHSSICDTSGLQRG